MEMEIGGFTVYGLTATKVREFIVAEASETDALAAMARHYPDVKVTSRKRVPERVIQMVQLGRGKIREQVNLEPGRGIRDAGVPVDKPL